MKAFFVNDRLAFGSKVRTVRHTHKLLQLGITHVINLRACPSKKIQKRFCTIWLPFRDDSRLRPAWFYRQALQFYQDAMKKPKATVFVMCRAGRRRSASLAYFLLRSSGASPTKAEALVRRARPCAQVVPAYRKSGEMFLRLKQRARVAIDPPTLKWGIPYPVVVQRLFTL